MKATKTGSGPVKTTCPYCGVGCGVLVKPGKGHQHSRPDLSPQPVAGDTQHPANAGRLCVKGASLHETTGGRDRLLYPEVNGQRVSWERVLDRVAGSIRDAVDSYGPGSVAFYLSGQLLTEDYYVANKLAKGFIGTPHVDTNSRLCMSSAVAAHKRSFGADAVPGCYEDLELADLLVLAGSNTAWNHPVLYQRMKAAAREGRRVVVIDPRHTATTELADLHLAIRPGTDTILFNGLLVWLSCRDALDWQYIEAHCTGFSQALASARQAAPDVAAVAQQCDLRPADVENFYNWFARTPRTVTAFSQGINQSVAGTDKGNAIINCHLATGRVGRVGASPFSLTGQPNAMGGREVGGLSNTLAAHMDYETPGARETVASFWRTGALAEGPGLKAVDLFEAVHRGDIKVLWIMGTNPAVSLPGSARIREALSKCPTVIVSDCVRHTDTSRFADILLPAAGWGEKNGTVTNSERCISRQRSFLPLPGEAKPDWWIVNAVGQRLGFSEAFDFQAPMEVFREHAALSAYKNQGQRLFNLSGLTHLSATDYEQLQPVQWPVPDKAAERPGGSQRLFSDGQFATPDGRARFVAVETILPAQQPDSDWPMVVNTGRIRDQWHTMTRTSLAPRLLAHRNEPFVEVHPRDIERLSLSDGHLATLNHRNGAFVGRVRACTGQRPGEVFVPIHWNASFASDGIASMLVEPVTDPLSGQPEAKHGTARIRPFKAKWHARLLVRKGRPRRWQSDYWSYVPLAASDSWWLAGRQPLNWPEEAGDWLGGAPQLIMADTAQGRFRAARLVEGRLESIILMDRDPAGLPDVGWLDSCFSGRALSESDRRSLLAARDVETEDVGAIVCSCFQVGERQIRAAVEGGVASVDGLAGRLKCGTNCGSCIPELRALLEASGVELAQE